MSYFLICDCKDTTFLQPTNKIKAFLLFYLKKYQKKWLIGLILRVLNLNDRKSRWYIYANIPSACIRLMCLAHRYY